MCERSSNNNGVQTRLRLTSLDRTFRSTSRNWDRCWSNNWKQLQRIMLRLQGETKMAERENEEQQMTDPPENTGGDTRAELDGAEENAKATDPPSNDGGN